MFRFTLSNLVKYFSGGERRIIIQIRVNPACACVDNNYTHKRCRNGNAKVWRAKNSAAGAYSPVLSYMTTVFIMNAQ